MKPRDATTMDNICKLRSDNKSAGGFWILLNSRTVTLTAQRMGHPATAQMNITRRQFNTLIDWYMRDQKALKRGRRK